MLDDSLTGTGKIVFNDGKEHVVRLVDVKYGNNIFKELLFEEDIDFIRNGRDVPFVSLVHIKKGIVKVGVLRYINTRLVDEGEYLSIRRRSQSPTEAINLYFHNIKDIRIDPTIYDDLTASVFGGILINNEIADFYSFPKPNKAKRKQLQIYKK